MTIKTHKVTSSGAKIPVGISIRRIPGTLMLDYQVHKTKTRDHWCTQGKPCSKFGCRPCCPPQVKMFSELKEHKYMYVIGVRIVLNDYYETYPNVKESKSWCYFGMDGTHKMSRNIQNQIAESFAGQAFRVGGCLGCQYMKTGKCKRFAPALEATGINVIELGKDILGWDITWRKAKEPMKDMIAIGGIYTDELIMPKQFKEVIQNVVSKH
jgi:predicted metal-binding protein